MEKEEVAETKEIDPLSVEKLEVDAYSIKNGDQEKTTDVKTQNISHNSPHLDNEQDLSDKIRSLADLKLEVDAFIVQNEDKYKQLTKAETQNIGYEGLEFENEDDISNKVNEVTNVKLNTHEEMKGNAIGESELAQRMDESRDLECGIQKDNFETSNTPVDLLPEVHECNSIKSKVQLNNIEQEHSGDKISDNGCFELKTQEVNVDITHEQINLAKERDGSETIESRQMNKKTDNNTLKEDNDLEPIFDGTEVPEIEANRSMSTHYLDTTLDTPRVVEKAIAFKKFVREKSLVAVSSMLHRLSFKRNESSLNNSDIGDTDVSNLLKDNKTNNKDDIVTEGPPLPIAMKGRIILYTRLSCQDCKEVRRFLYIKRLRYVEINTDVYPSRKMELERNSGSASVPKVFFNEILIGGLSELKSLNESGKLDEKIDFLITEAPSFEAPLPPLSGEDDVSTSGALDEMALIVRKMKEFIVVKDRFSKMRRFTNCFLGSEAVDFLSEDQYLEREEVSFILNVAEGLVPVNNQHINLHVQSFIA